MVAELLKRGYLLLRAEAICETISAKEKDPVLKVGSECGSGLLRHISAEYKCKVLCCGHSMLSLGGNYQYFFSIGLEACLL